MEEKDTLIRRLFDEIASLKKIIAEQSTRITELEKRLGKNSNNNSKPLSSDGLSKPPSTNRTSSLRQTGKNKIRARFRTLSLAHNAAIYLFPKLTVTPPI